MRSDKILIIAAFIGIIIVAVETLTFVSISGCRKETKQPPNIEPTKSEPRKAPTVVFDVTSLAGKTEKEIVAVLGPPTDKGIEKAGAEGFTEYENVSAFKWAIYKSPAPEKLTACYADYDLKTKKCFAAQVSLKEPYPENINNVLAMFNIYPGPGAFETDAEINGKGKSNKTHILYYCPHGNVTEYLIYRTWSDNPTWVNALRVTFDGYEFW